MKLKLAILFVVLSLSAVAVLSAPVKQLELHDRVLKVVRKHHPNARIAQDNGNFVAKHGTMVFTVHQRWKTGEVRKETAQVEGPNFKGFLLSISVQNGKYEGAARVPQTLRRPYWQTYIDRPPTEDAKGHYVINFSYGSRLDREFMKALFEALPKSKMPTKP